MPVPEPKIKPCFLRIPGHMQTPTLPWGRRKWAQPSRIRRPQVRRGGGMGHIVRTTYVKGTLSKGSENMFRAGGGMGLQGT